MEIPEEIIKQAFTLIKSEGPHPGLISALKKLEAYSLELLLFNNGRNDNLRHDSDQVRGFCTGVYNDPKHLATVVSAALRYLNLFASTGEQKKLAIYLHVNCYLMIDHALYWKNLDKPSHQKKRMNELAELVQQVKIKVNSLERAGYYENNLMLKANEGLAEMNIDRVYDFVLALERGGQGFHINYLLEHLLSFFFRLGQIHFARQLNRLSLTEEFVFYLQSFPRPALRTLMSRQDIVNPWVLFELMRQACSRAKRDKLFNFSETKAMASCLDRLYHVDAAMYAQAVTFLHQSEIFNEALGMQLKNLNEGDQASLFGEWIPMNQYDHNLKARTKLLHILKRVVDDKTFSMILECTYKRWRAVLDKLLSDHDSYFNNLFQTDFANFIVNYYSELSPEQVVEPIIQLLTRINWIDSEWAVNSSDQNKILTLLFSDLYLLSYAYLNKKIKDSEVKRLAILLRENTLLVSREHNDPMVQYLPQLVKHLI